MVRRPATPLAIDSGSAIEGKAGLRMRPRVVQRHRVNINLGIEGELATFELDDDSRLGWPCCVAIASKDDVEG